MSDGHLRELERRFRASRATEDEAAWLGARVQAGMLEECRVRLAAYLGHDAASWLLHAASAQTDAPSEVSEWVRGLGPWGKESIIRVGVVASYRLEPLLVRLHPDFRQDASQAFRRLLRAVETSLVQPTKESHTAMVELATHHGMRPTSPATSMLKATAGYSGQSRPARRLARHVAELLGRGLLDARSFRADVRSELVPWALGYGDPVRERVEARQWETAGG